MSDKLAILGGTPVRSAPIAQPWPRFGETTILAQQHYTTFSERFAAHHGAEHGVLCTNGSVSLEVCLNALDVEYGDEVIVPTYTWIATAAAPIHLNAVPVLVDVEARNYCIDPEQVEAAITESTRAIIAVHLGASIADLDRLKAIALRHGVALIEDCAHAHGGAWRDQGVGSHGDFGSFSFQVSKLMTCGEGGMVTTRSEELAARAHWIVNCGRKEPGFDGFPGRRFGYNSRVSEFQAAVLLGQLERLADDTGRREEAIGHLTAGLASIGGLTPLERDERVTAQSAYQWILRYEPEAFAGKHRNRVLHALAAEGVACDGPFYVPMHHHELFTAESRHWPALRDRYGDGFKSAETQRALNPLFPVTSKAAYEEAVWMHYPYLMGSRADLDAILEAVAKVKRNAHLL